MDLLKKRLDMRLNIYFALTFKQQGAFNDHYNWQFMENVPMDKFKRITKSKRLHNMLTELKRLSIRTCAA